MCKDGPRVRIHEKKQRTMVKVKAAVCDAIRECAMGRSSWPLVLIGGVGCGKTCAALCLCDYTVGRLAFIAAPDLADRLADAKCGRLMEWTADHGENTRVTPRILWEDWERKALCVVDDLGQRDKNSDTAYEAVKQAIDRREGLPLIVTTNIGLDDLIDIYDARVVSRLSAGTVIEIEGEDGRLDFREAGLGD